MNVKMHKAVRIKTSTALLTPPGLLFVDRSAYVYAVLISIQAAGTGWKLRIQDNQAEPRGPLVLIPDTTLSAPTTADDLYSIEWVNPKLMKGGIRIVTTGPTPGEVAVWIDYATSDVEVAS